MSGMTVASNGMAKGNGKASAIAPGGTAMKGKRGAATGRERYAETAMPAEMAIENEATENGRLAERATEKRERAAKGESEEKTGAHRGKITSSCYESSCS